VQADIREWYNDAQWVIYGDGDAAFTVAYVSPTSFSVAGVDVTAVYHPGRRVKASGPLTGAIYGSITAAAFATNTTVTVQWDAGALQNEAFTVAIGIIGASGRALPQAAAGTPGGVQLASAAETGAGVSATKAVTPAALAAAPMVWTAGHVFRSTDGGAGEIAAIDLDRASATPAAGDLLMSLRWLMRDAGGGADVAARILARLLDPTAGSEDAELHFATLVAGALATRLVLGQGLYTPNAPGGDKGADTIGALELYARGNPLGYQAVAAQAGATCTLVQNDLNAVVKLTNAAGCTVTLPSIAAVGAGWRVRLLNASGGDAIVQRAGSDPIDGGGTSVKIQNAPGRNVMDWWTDGAAWYTSRRTFVSAPQTITSGGALTLPHGLGAPPTRVTARLRCIAAEAGYSLDDEMVTDIGDPIGAGAGLGGGVGGRAGTADRVADEGGREDEGAAAAGDEGRQLMPGAQEGGREVRLDGCRASRRATARRPGRARRGAGVVEGDVEAAEAAHRRFRSPRRADRARRGGAQ
jgi:hypothetical protein